MAGRTPFSETVRSAQFRLLWQVFMEPGEPEMGDVTLHAGDPLIPETAVYVADLGDLRKTGPANCAVA